MSTPRFVPAHPEGPRYATSLLFVPGLWASPEAMQPIAGFLGHRGWEGLVVDLEGVPGGLADRADAIVGALPRRPEPMVLIGHDAGGLLALEVARRVPVRALVLLAPIVPGARELRRLISPWAVLRMLLGGSEIACPQGPARAALLGTTRPAALRSAEPGQAVVDVIRGRVDVAPTGGPTLLVRGETDTLLSPGDLRQLAGRLNAEVVTISGCGRWLLDGPRWQACVGAVHRWLVQTLGEELLELYAEMMAERDDD